MPRFSLDDGDMAALIGYLKRLDQRRVPGVGETVLHFATIVTPDADPVKRRGMLDVLQKYFADKNATPIGATPRLRSASRMTMFMANRQWELHVWQLSGPEATWEEQLEQRLAKEPVFAVISGLAGRTWAPVQAFCEREALPCLFPNVEAPPAAADGNFYSLYFSQGVLLEAQLIAAAIGDSAGPAPKLVRQVYRAGDSGEAGAQALGVALKAQGIAVRDHVVAGDTAQAVRAAGNADVLVLWLREADLAKLADPPPESATVFASGLLAGLERAPLPGAWRSRVRLAYPLDLPDKRRIRTDYAFGWFRIRQVPVVAEQVQADTFLACGLLAETLNHVADTFVRDYLIERLEDIIEHRIMTGYYPRLTLATGQRFASKGGYIARFEDLQGKGPRLVADFGLNIGKPSPRRTP
jgi:hypothetical protein